MKNLKSKGQSITEYALVLGLIGTILVGLELYIKPRIQAVVRAASDQLGNQEDARMIDLDKGELQGSNFTTRSDTVLKHLTQRGGKEKFKIGRTAGVRDPETGEVMREITTRWGHSFSERK